ncbi:reverse transcriptase domain, reverse transcriptase zinc-binding domain protein, partial [Tanacetum coccineum]
ENWQNGWNLAWVRNSFSGYNASQLVILQNMISSIILNDSEDTWTWSLGGNFFTVRSARCQIDGEFLLDQGHSTRWNQIIPKKVNIFVWRASRDRLPSRWNLSRRGIEVNSLNCPICDAGTETSFHTLWACSLASLVWIRVFKWVDLFIPTISSLSDLFIWIDESTLPGIFLMAFKRVIERLLGSNGLRCLLLRISEGWEFLVSSLSSGLFFSSGYGAIFLMITPYGPELYQLYMA